MRSNQKLNIITSRVCQVKLLFYQCIYCLNHAAHWLNSTCFSLIYSCTAVQRQSAVTTLLKSKQLLLFVFYLQDSAGVAIFWGCNKISELGVCPRKGQRGHGTYLEWVIEVVGHVLRPPPLPTPGWYPFRSRSPKPGQCMDQENTLATNYLDR